MPLPPASRISRRGRFPVTLALLALALAAASAANGATVSFAQFHEANRGSDPRREPDGGSAAFTLRAANGQPEQTSGGARWEDFETATLVLSRNTAGTGGSGPHRASVSVGFAGATFAGPGPADRSNAGNGAPTTLGNSSVNFLDLIHLTVRGLGQNRSWLRPPGLPSDVERFHDGVAAADAGTFASEFVPIVVPEASGGQALSILVGVVGLWELLRRFRKGWVAIDR